ncbi:MAG: hypothetical protein KAX05_16400 [Bacteroidales bacterium]|nr:hypothetical protein [Bacteroidales bacterium]
MKTKEIFTRQTNFFEKFREFELNGNELFIIRGGDDPTGEPDDPSEPPVFPEEG